MFNPSFNLCCTYMDLLQKCIVQGFLQYGMKTPFHSRNVNSKVYPRVSVRGKIQLWLLQGLHKDFLHGFTPVIFTPSFTKVCTYTVYSSNVYIMIHSTSYTVYTKMFYSMFKPGFTLIGLFQPCLIQVLIYVVRTWIYSRNV